MSPTSPTIVFYISGHGFGHASREVEVINALAARSPLQVRIRSALRPDLFERTLRVPFELTPTTCDTGVIQRTSLQHDDEGTVRQAAEFHRTWNERIETEARALAATPVDLVVGDVPALAFEVAARLGVPSVALANFTWDWIYETHPGFATGAPGVLEQLRAAYRRADFAIRLPLSAGFEVFDDVRPIPLIARRPTHDRRATRAHFGLPENGRVALLSFGGYGLPELDLSQVDCQPDWTVVTTDRVTGDAASAPWVRRVIEREFLTSTFRYEDLVAASDVVLSKPGYGIISECVATGTALLYTSRGAFREYDLLVGELPRYVRSRFISQADLFAGRWRDAFEALLRQSGPATPVAVDGADVAATILADVLAH